MVAIMGDRSDLVFITLMIAVMMLFDSVAPFIRLASSNPIAKECATNAWWHEVIVPRRGKNDF
jgi:hypothetical protein